VDGVTYEGNRQFHFTDPLLTTVPGDTVTITVLRGEETLTFEITLGE